MKIARTSALSRHEVDRSTSNESVPGKSGSNSSSCSDYSLAFIFRVIFVRLNFKSRRSVFALSLCHARWRARNVFLKAVSTAVVLFIELDHIINAQDCNRGFRGEFEAFDFRHCRF
jgi:hypothetical protein